MSARALILAGTVAALPVMLVAQGVGAPVKPADLYQPLKDTWPTYSGDYTGRRFSSLTQINQRTVRNLTLAWTGTVTAGTGLTGFAGGRGGGGGGAGANFNIGGHGTVDFPTGGANIKGTPLMVGDTLYVSSPDNAWAVDARDGRVLWQYYWKTRGGTHIANRGLGMWNDTLYMETPDNYLVAIDAKTGKERWNVEIASFEEQYFSTTAPIVIDEHVIVGTGNDLDMPGFLQSFNARTGKLEWKFYTVPMQPGDPGLDTWASLDAARHGGAQPWLPGAFDPETRLYVIGTGNPTPAYTQGRGEGDNLFTCSLVAINVDTGKMAWYFQTSPHDRHDWDSAQTPIMFDAVVNGRRRKLVATAARNGYFFTVDRVTGEHLVSTKYGSTSNWVQSISPNGSLRRNPDKDPTIPGALVSPTANGTINWEPPAYSPDTGLFYVAEKNGFSIFYLTDPDPRGSMGLGGKIETGVGSGGNYLTAIDPRSGRIAWRHRYPGNNAGGGGGILATAGGLVFAGDGAGNIVAHNSRTGAPIWHSRIGNVTNGPQTYMLDGRQYLLVATGDRLWAFMIY
jgi:alcohol dehydrogenase (cytochrome c)